MSAASAKRSPKRLRRSKQRARLTSDDVTAELLQNMRGGNKQAILVALTFFENLTPELVRGLVLLLGKDDVMFLPRVRKIDVATAAELAEFPGGVSLPALKHLGRDLADALIGGQSALQLSGIRRLDRPTAEIVSHAAPVVFLDGLAKLTKPVARALAAGTADIILSGLSNPGRQTLAAFAEGSESAEVGLLGLDGITSRSLDVGLASALVAINKDLRLGGVRFLEEPVASVLGGCHGALHLPLLYRVDNRSLAALAQVPGSLDLSGLGALPPVGAGVRALVGRTRPFYLSEWCKMGRKARVLLESSRGIEWLARQPAELPPSRRDQLRNRKLRQEVRKEVAQSICHDVFAAVSGGKRGACTATWARWLTEEVDLGGAALANRRGRSGVSCWDVYYFLSEGRAKALAAGNDLLQNYCHDQACKRAEKLSESTNSKKFEDGEHLYRSLYVTARRGALTAWKKYDEGRGQAVSLDAEDPATDRSWSASLPDDKQSEAAKKIGQSESPETEIVAQAEKEYAEAGRRLRDLQAEGKGNIREAKKKCSDALIWLEWVREAVRRAENGLEKKFGQQEFAGIFLDRHPWSPVSQSRLSRVIGSKRAELRRQRKKQL